MTAEPDAQAARVAHSAALQLLREGRYAEGLPLFEARSQIPGGPSPKPALPFPEWRGEDIAGKHLLVWPEQGFGDKLMWSRFIPDLQVRGARVSALAEPGLVRLFTQNFTADILAASGPVELPEADVWALYGSLPLRLGVALETLSGRPYLAAPPRAVPGAAIGVVTQGAPRHPNDANRSLPAWAAEELLDLPGALRLHHGDLGIGDFWDTAQLVAGLDLVITVDSAVAHLAGALGKPVWILLPAQGTDWRWMQGRDDSPWYASARLFRQPSPGDWGPVLAMVRTALAAR
jgi:hypothetical protein